MDGTETVGAVLSPTSGPPSRHFAVQSVQWRYDVLVTCFASECSGYRKPRMQRLNQLWPCKEAERGQPIPSSDYPRRLRFRLSSNLRRRTGAHSRSRVGWMTSGILPRFFLARRNGTRGGSGSRSTFLIREQEKKVDCWDRHHMKMRK